MLALYILATLMPLFIDYQTPEDIVSPWLLGDCEEFDFIIVGAGPAGCVLANRLSEIEGWSVLLLEAGGGEPLPVRVPSFTPFARPSRLSWGFSTQPQEALCGGESCPATTGRGLGGGSLINLMMYNRGNERIFNLWQEMGNPGWSFDDVLPYFKKSEDNLDSCIANNTHYHNTAGLQTIGRFPHQDSNSRLLLNALQELDLKETDINAESQAGSMRMQFFQNAGTRQSAGKAFLDPIRHGRPNLAIVTNARVTKVIVGHETREAEGVEYVLEDNKFIKRIAFASKEVLLCAGAVNSPQLLMLSGIGPIKTLQSLGIAVIEDLNVGRNLQNHFKTGIDLILDEKRQTVPKNQDVVDDILRYFWRHEGALASVGTFDVTAYINSTFSTRNFPDIQFLFFPQFFHPNQSFHTPLSYYNRISVETIAVRPRTRGYIAINTTDPFSQPIINYILDSHDIDVISQGNDFVVKELMNTKTLKENGMSVDTEPNTKCKDFTFGTFNYFRCLATNYSYPSYHFSGTCKMGPSSDRSAVVDSSLRVHKIKKLRVVDASVMPVLVNANPHAAVLMIAEKASDLIKEAWT